MSLMEIAAAGWRQTAWLRRIGRDRVLSVVGARRFEITNAGGVTLVAKAYLSRESYDREMIGWLTARQYSLSPPLFWYPYFKATRRMF